MIAQNWLDLSAERGPSNFDQRHLVTLQTQYSIGRGRKRRSAAARLAGHGVQGLDADQQHHRGQRPAADVRSILVAVAGTGVTGSIRPDYTGRAGLRGVRRAAPESGGVRARRQPGQWGNAGRNSITGPSQFIMNASLGRTFRGESRTSGSTPRTR